MDSPKTPKWIRICEAMVLARAQNKPPRTAQSWAEEFQVFKTYTHRLAKQLGYEEFFAAEEKRTSSITVNMHYRTSKAYRQRTQKPMAMVPTSLLRGAELADKKKLKMSVDSPGKILVEAANV